jgi:hypothetical protein
MRLAFLTAAALLLSAFGAAAVEMKIQGKDVDVPVCGGFVGIPCKGDQWCDYPQFAQCGIGDQFGVCRPRPQVCAEMSLPVCACDGKTYDNACKAHRAGFDVYYPGPCR